MKPIVAERETSHIGMIFSSLDRLDDIMRNARASDVYQTTEVRIMLISACVLAFACVFPYIRP